jgi:ArsR family transcriptional regulator, arsenate/arsenite/antimonite-responsive transcriptional repressor
MESKRTVVALKALAHPHRLELFRLLVQAGNDGLTVGALQASTGHAGATLSNHLNTLRRAGLIRDRRVSRNIWCRADYGQMNALIAYLTENCCAGADCAPASACKPSPASAKRRTRQ